jgi:hypothetical protein
MLMVESCPYFPRKGCRFSIGAEHRTRKRSYRTEVSDIICCIDAANAADGGGNDGGGSPSEIFWGIDGKKQSCLYNGTAFFGYGTAVVNPLPAGWPPVGNI